VRTCSLNKSAKVVLSDHVCYPIKREFCGDRPVVLNEFFKGDGDILFERACKLGCEGIVSKRLGSTYRSGRSPHLLKIKNPHAPAVKREAEEDWR
jgi:ATP-dependent DNA ligase